MHALSEFEMLFGGTSLTSMKRHSLPFAFPNAWANMPHPECIYFYHRINEQGLLVGANPR